MSHTIDKKIVNSKLKLFFCAEQGCKASFSKPAKLKTHSLVHSGERPFVCEYDDCVMAFRRAYHLKRHEKVKHEKKESINCPVENCSLTYSSDHVLQKHMATKHNIQKPRLKCSSCNKDFLKHQHLKVHEFQHTGIKPYPCTVEGCGKSFLIPSVLKKHQKRHRGYKCEHPGCTEEFPKWALYLAHKKKDHANIEYKCPICDKAFKIKNYLRQHKAVHSSDAPGFPCPHEECSRNFFLKKNLKQHLKNYHIKPRFKCTHDGCDQEYIYKASLTRHMKSHETGYQPSLKTEKKLYKYHKRKSAAAILSTYEPSLEEERSILKKDKIYMDKSLFDQQDLISNNSNEGNPLKSNLE